MKQMQRMISLAAGLFLFLGVVSLEAATYSVKAVSDGGTVKGKIALNGSAPAPAVTTIKDDTTACGTSSTSEELVVSGSGGIQNAVVTIEGVKAGKDWDANTQKFVYDQKNCKFIPHIIVIAPKAAGTILNSDSVGHNLHTVSKGIISINKKIQGNSEMEIKENKIKKSGIVEVKCDLHSWMKGWWFVAENPYTVITDADGNFSLDDQVFWI